MFSSAQTPRIAYLCGMYPAVSLTFILREIEALRALGIVVLTCSIRPTPPLQHPGAVEKAHAQTTFNVLPALKNPLVGFRALGWSLRRPIQLLRMLGLAGRTRGPGLRASLYQLAYAAEAVVLAHYLAENEVDHLHNHFVSASATVAMLAAGLAGIPYSYTLHGPTDFIEPLRWRIDVKTANAAFVACISHYARSQCMFYSDPAHWNRLKIVHCGVDPDLYDRPRPERPSEPVQLLFVGRLARVKGLLVLFDALDSLGAGIPRVRLTVVGDGPERELLENAAESLGERVHFAGYRSQDQVAEILTKTDVFVLPSFAEGVPVVLMEALAARVPVIATRVAGVTELVEDGVSGILIPPSDVDSLARAIDRLAGSADLRMKMSGTGRETVVERFNSSTEARKLLTLFREAALPP